MKKKVSIGILATLALAALAGISANSLVKEEVFKAEARDEKLNMSLQGSDFMKSDGTYQIPTSNGWSVELGTMNPFDYNTLTLLVPKQTAFQAHIEASSNPLVNEVTRIHYSFTVSVQSLIKKVKLLTYGGKYQEIAVVDHSQEVGSCDYSGDLIFAASTSYPGFRIRVEGNGTEHYMSNIYVDCYKEITTANVTFNANGHGTAPDAQTVDIGNKATQPSNPSATGYTFGGWYKEAACTNKWNFSSDTVEGDTTLYAKWTANTYTVTLNKQNGTGGSNSVTATYNANMPSATMPTRTGYTFNGYYDATSGGTKYYNANGSSARTWNKTSNATLYARWTANQYTVTLNDGTGTGGSGSTTATYGSAPSNVNVPTRTGYTFAGYFTGSNGTGTQYYNATGKSVKNWDITSNTTLYAYWTKNMTVTSSGYNGIWDGNPHTITVNVTDPIDGYDIKYGYSQGEYNLTENPQITDVNDSKTIYFTITKKDYTPYFGSANIVISKNESIVDPRPSAILDLEYTALDQELVVAGEVDYGEMLYAVSNDNSQVPASSEFFAQIPTGKLVGTYYVFYKSSGDANHNPYQASLDNVVAVEIARVDRSEAIAKNNEVSEYLLTLDDRFTSIKGELESLRATFEDEAIDEDNITAEGVANKVLEMQANLSAAKVAVTEQLINAIGTVVYPDSKDAMLEALNYYTNVLNDNEKAMVNAELKALLDHDIDLYDTVDGIAKIIKDLPSPAQSRNYYDAVDNAKAAYDALNEEEILTFQNATDFDYEKKLLDNVAAREVIELIDDIDDVTYNGGVNDSKATIEAAEEGYANLTSDQKALIVNINTLTHDREVYDNVHNSVQLIEAIGKVENSEQSKLKIDAAREAYDELTKEEKKLVNHYNLSYKTLDDAEHVYQALVLIDDIGNLAYDTDPEGRILIARKYYDSLTADQKAQVGEEYLNILIKAEKDSAHITKVNTTWLVIGLILSVLIIAGGAAFIFFLFHKKKNDDDNENNQKGAVKVASFGGLLPLITLISHYYDSTWVILYILAPVALLVAIACLVLFILKKKKVGPFKEKEPALEEEEEVMEVTDENGNKFQIRFIKSFTAKLIQSSDETKKYYEELKNEVLSYKGVSSRISWHFDSINSGRTQAIKFGIRGKTLCVYYSLDINEVNQDKYSVEIMESKKYMQVPLMYRIKNPRRVKRAKELIAMVMAKLGLVKGEEQHELYSNLPYEENRPLINRGLIKELKVRVGQQEELEVLETRTNADGDEIIVEKDNQGNIFEIRYIKSFSAKLSQADDVTKDYYNILKNYVLSYKDVHSRVSWHYDAINIGRDYILKFAIRGKTLCLFFALDASKLDDKYKVEEAKGRKFLDVPVLYRIKNERRLGYAKELIDLLMKEFNLKKGQEPHEDYRLPYEDTKTLLGKKLIKEVKTKIKGTKEEHHAITVSEADEMMSDTAAISSIEEDTIHHRRKGQRAIVNIDTLSENYRDGETVDLESLIAKKLVSPKTGYVKVLARGILDKKLIVDLDDFSLQAVKMIVLMGGQVKKIK